MCWRGTRGGWNGSRRSAADGEPDETQDAPPGMGPAGRQAPSPNPSPASRGGAFLVRERAGGCVRWPPPGGLRAATLPRAGGGLSGVRDRLAPPFPRLRGRGGRGVRGPPQRTPAPAPREGCRLEGARPAGSLAGLDSVSERSLLAYGAAARPRRQPGARPNPSFKAVEIRPSRTPRWAGTSRPGCGPRQRCSPATRAARTSAPAPTAPGTPPARACRRGSTRPR